MIKGEIALKGYPHTSVPCRVRAFAEYGPASSRMCVWIVFKCEFMWKAALVKDIENMSKQEYNNY